MTDRGVRTISDLYNRDDLFRVMSYRDGTSQLSGYTRVVHTKDSDTLVKFTMEDGSTFQCTPDHRLLVLNNGIQSYVEANSLQVGDELVTT